MSRYMRSRAEGRDGGLAPTLGPPDQTSNWLFYELQCVRREAQVEAQLAYEAWRQSPGRDEYTVYRALRIAPTPRRTSSLPRYAADTTIEALRADAAL
jgi:hypothetical protein